MTTTPTPSPTAHAPAPRADHRPGQRAAAAALALGGVLFALGNALHPLEHSDAATRAPTWAAAHLVFALGALLIAAGLPALGRRLADSRLALGGLIGWAVGMVLVVGSAYVEVYVAPVVGHDTMHVVEEGAAVWGVLTLLTYVLAPVAVAAVGLFRRRLPVAPCVGVVLGQALMVAAQVLPAPEGLYIIPGTVLFGLSSAWLGLATRHDATAE